jgi:DNA-binding response OmpR family regulator
VTETRPATPRVLVADDDPTMVLLVEHALEGLGRVYDTATDGAAAWRLWEQHRHPLVVLDIEMPGLDGLEVCRRIRQNESERATFVLIVTGRDRAADLESVLEAGADDYVTKPTSGQRLVARLRIAERRMADNAARRAAEEELRSARYLAGIGEAMVALQHEINNPLAALLGTAELALMESGGSGKAAEDLQAIIEEARRIAVLLRRVADLRNPKSVPYAGDAKMIDLREPT